MTTKKRTTEEDHAIRELLKSERLLETFPDTDDFVEARYPNCKHCNAPKSVPTCVMTQPGESGPSKMVCGACCKALQAEGWAFTGIGEPRPLPDPKP